MKQRSMSDRMISVSASPRLAAGLIIASCGLVVLSVLVPQASYLTSEQMEAFRRSAGPFAAVLDRLGVTNVFSSWAAAAVAVLLAVNVTACTVRRLVRRVRMARRAAEVASAADTTSEASDLPRSLADAGWTVVSTSGETVRAIKGSSGFWGSMALHLGILVVIVGAFVSVLTSFNGNVVMTEGQAIVDRPEDYDHIARRPRIGSPFTGAELRLDSMDVGYVGGERTRVVARVTSRPADGLVSQQVVRVNEPLEVAGTTYLLENSGYAPQLVTSVQGRAQRQVVRLSEETRYGWRDLLRLPEVRRGGGPAQLEMLATPVPLSPGQVLPDEKLQIEDPRLSVTLRDSRGVVSKATLARGRSATLAPGVTVTFEDLLLWTRFMVRRNPSRWVVYIGFWLCVLGAAWRFLVPERRLVIRASAEETPVVVERWWPLPPLLGRRDQDLPEGVPEPTSGSASLG